MRLSLTTVTFAKRSPRWNTQHSKSLPHQEKAETITVCVLRCTVINFFLGGIAHFRMTEWRRGWSWYLREACCSNVLERLLFEQVHVTIQSSKYAGLLIKFERRTTVWTHKQPKLSNLARNSWRERSYEIFSARNVRFFANKIRSPRRDFVFTMPLENVFEFQCSRKTGWSLTSQ